MGFGMRGLAFGMKDLRLWVILEVFVLRALYLGSEFEARCQ